MPCGVYVRTAEIRMKNSISNTGKKYPPRSEEHSKKLSIALTGKKKSAEHCLNLSLECTGLHSGELNPMYGKKHSEETKVLMSTVKLGNKNPMFGIRNEMCYQWKGNDIGYMRIHDWLRDKFGNPKSCELCNKIGEKIKNRWNIDYALLKNKEHSRIRDNYIGLCKSCHNSYDGIVNNLKNKRAVN